MRGGLIPRMIAGCALLIVMVAAVSGALVIAFLDERDMDRSSVRSMEIIRTDEQVEQLLLDLDRAELGFLATHDPSLLDTWAARQASLAEHSARLERLAHTAEQTNLARRITRDGQSFLRDQAMPVLRAAQRGDPAAASVSTVREDARRVAELEAELDALAAGEQRFAAEREQRSRATVRAAMTTVIAGMVGAVLVAAFLIAYLTRVVVRPVRQVAAMAGDLERGNLGGIVPEAGAGEVGQLTRAFNAMSGSVRHSVEGLVRHGKAQSALRRIATHAAHGAAVAEVLETVATELGALIGTDSAHILRYEDDGTATVVAAWGTPDPATRVGARLAPEGDDVSATVLATGKPFRIDSPADVPGPTARQQQVRSRIGAPIIIEGRLWGAVTATVTGDRSLAPAAEARLADSTDLIAATIANAQARADLAASRARLVVAADRARRQIERNLHDTIQQQLITIAIALGDAETSVPAHIPQLRQRLSAVTHRLTDVLDELREIARRIHPAILSDRGLGSALKALARRSDLPVSLDLHLDRRLPEPVEVAAYYIAAEALANAAEHALGTHVRIEASIHSDRLHLDIEDDGVPGIEPADSGFIGLTDRVNALGGTVTISSSLSQGTRLHTELPLDLTPT